MVEDSITALRYLQARFSQVFYDFLRDLYFAEFAELTIVYCIRGISRYRLPTNDCLHQWWSRVAFTKFLAKSTSLPENEDRVPIQFWRSKDFGHACLMSSSSPAYKGRRKKVLFYQVIIWGHSLGAAVAVALASKVCHQQCLVNEI